VVLVSEKVEEASQLLYYYRREVAVGLDIYHTLNAHLFKGSATVSHGPCAIFVKKIDSDIVPNGNGANALKVFDYPLGDLGLVENESHGRFVRPGIANLFQPASLVRVELARRSGEGQDGVRVAFGDEVSKLFHVFCRHIEHHSLIECSIAIDFVKLIEHSSDLLVRTDTFQLELQTAPTGFAGFKPVS